MRTKKRGGYRKSGSRLFCLKIYVCAVPKSGSLRSPAVSDFPRAIEKKEKVLKFLVVRAYSIEIGSCPSLCVNLIFKYYIVVKDGILFIVVDYF